MSNGSDQKVTVTLAVARNLAVYRLWNGAITSRLLRLERCRPPITSVRTVCPGAVYSVGIGHHSDDIGTKGCLSHRGHLTDLPV